MDPYEDPRRPVAERAGDLLARMAIEEKVGLMFQPPLEAAPDGSLLETGGLMNGPSTAELVSGRHIRHGNLMYFPGEAALVARWTNHLQKLAEQSRLGIPVLMSTDPCHGAADAIGLSHTVGSFSQWPPEIGLGALHDPDAVREVAQVARQEYTTVGLRAALHPQVDLASEPRWTRLSGTFGVDADLVTSYVRA